MVLRVSARARVARRLSRFPTAGLYDGQQIVFERGADGKATVAIAGTVRFKRRPLPADDDRVNFQITPVQTGRRAADARRSPRAPDGESANFRAAGSRRAPESRPDHQVRHPLRDVEQLHGHAVLLVGARVHAAAGRGGGRARASAELRKLGYGLLIHDAYRPWYVTKMFWDGTPPDKHMFVADPSQGSRHNRGCAVDLTLYDLKTGEPIRMTGGYDEMTDRSYPLTPAARRCSAGTATCCATRWRRRASRSTRPSGGTSTTRTGGLYPIGTLTFEQLEASRR